MPVTLKLNSILLTIALFAISCMNQKINKPQKNFLDKQGHRGCRGLMPENTIAAMIKAIDLGVTTLEMDVVITKDKQVLVSHEPFFNHEISTKPDGSPVTEAEERSLNIYEMNYEDVKKFDVGIKPHPRFPQQQKIKAIKPLLSELIDSVEDYCRSRNLPDLNYNIETKTQPATDNLYHPGPKEFVDLLIPIVRKKGIGQRVIIQSFDFRTLQYIHQQYPEFKTAILIEENDKRSFEEQTEELGFLPTIYSPEVSFINKELIKKCHEHKLMLIPWTVNDRNKIKELIQTGVDGIITDYPNLFEELK